MPMKADKRDELPDWLPPKIEEPPADEAQQIIEEGSPAPIVEPQPESSNVWVAA
jgi:hypothetical protein